MPKKRTYPAPKSAFILAHPTLSGAEIVARAKAQGIEMSRNLVYVIRSRRAKMRGPNGARGARSRNRPPVTPSPRPTRARTSALTAEEMRLAEVVLTIGLHRVEALLGQLRKRLRN